MPAWFRHACCALCLGALCLRPSAAEEVQREPRPGDIEGSASADPASRPLDAIEAERRVTTAELQDLRRRLSTLSTTQERRRERLRVRLRALYKLLQNGWGRLVLGTERPKDLYVRRDGARRVIGRDLEELRALRDELQDLSREQAAHTQAQARVSLLEEEAARIRAGKTGREVAGLGRLRGELPRPVAPGEVLVPFGREVVERGLEVFHPGIELSAEPGAPVRVVAGGQVRYTGEVAGQGAGVIVEHAGGYLTLYARLDGISVVAGDLVQRGTVLGRAVLPRVYFALALLDLPLDPEEWFVGGATSRRPAR